MIPFDQRSGLIWLDGLLVDWPDATLHVLTHGLHYASSVFEGIRVYGGEPFLLDDHLARLNQSGHILDFEVPYSVEELREATIDLVRRAGHADGYVRINAWRGSEVIQTAAPHTSVHVSIATWEVPSGYYAPTDAADSGISLMTGGYRRPGADCAPVKSKAAGNYMIGTITKNQALRAGFDDAMLLDTAGLIAESTGAHLFFTRAGEFYTPTTRCTIDGITRACVLAIAERLSIPVHVDDIEPAFVTEADGAFICGTACEILPVKRIDDMSYAVGSNDVIRTIADEYRRLTTGPHGLVQPDRRTG